MNGLKNSKHIKEFLLYFFIFFPYITTFSKSIDTAPYALLYSIGIVLLFKRKKLPIELWILFFLFFSAFMILIINGINFTILRTLAGYFSVFIIASATYFILTSNRRVNVKLIYRFFIAWFVVGVVQALIYPEFLTLFIVRSTTTAGRGITSLAPEPTYYASVVIFFIIVTYITNYKFKTILFLGIISIITLSVSATGAFVILLYLIFYIIFFILNKKMLYTIFISIILFILLYVNFDMLQGTRLFKLTNMLFENPASIFIIDASGNARLWNIIGAFMGSFDNFFLPNSNIHFRESLIRYMDLHPEFANPYSYKIATDKIMSGTGQIFYNLGFLGLLYFYSFFSLSFKYFRSLKKSIFLTFCLFLIMTTAIPLTFPIFGFVYRLLAYKAYKEPYENTNNP